MALQRVNYSAGLVIEEMGRSVEWSFIVHGSGAIEVVGDWDHRGPVPDFHDQNSPANLDAVLTVGVQKITDDALRAVRKIVERHLARFGQCDVWTTTQDRKLGDWVRAGCPPLPEPKPEPAPTASAVVRDEGSKASKPSDPKTPTDAEPKPARKPAKTRAAAPGSPGPAER